MIGLIDYGMGNLRSVADAFGRIGVSVKVVADAKAMRECSAIALPGVGAFDAAMDELDQRGLTMPLRCWLWADKPFLGICLGMQLLGKTSDEGKRQGLGVLDAYCRKLPNGLHVGWDEAGGKDYYFTHSYHLVCDPSIVTHRFVDDGREYVAAIKRGSMTAVQFHPEKSQRAGLQLLRQFAETIGPNNRKESEHGHRNGSPAHSV